MGLQDICGNPYGVSDKLFFQQKEIILMGEKRSALFQNQLGKVWKVFSTQVSVIALIDAKT